MRRLSAVIALAIAVTSLRRAGSAGPDDLPGIGIGERP
jgi:hypothetical protein